MNNQDDNRKHSEESTPLTMLVDAADSRTAEKRIGEKAIKPDSPPPAVAVSSASTSAQSANSSVQSHNSSQRNASDSTVMSGTSLLRQQAALAAAAQQQLAALALATDIRAAVATAQLQQANQIQNQDILIARATALGQNQLNLAGIGQQQLGLASIADGLSKEQLEQLQEYQKQLLSMASPMMSAPASQLTSSVLAARQQLQDAQMAPGQTNQDTILDRAGLHRAPAHSGSSLAGSFCSGSTQVPPGSSIVPCRARGMPMDHNFKTAYFIIPDKSEHGEELVCSYFACRNAGIKFRYCSHCKVPVAKRNFRKRHSHGDAKRESGSTGTESNSGDESVSTSLTSSKTSSKGSSDDAKRKAETSLVQKVQAAARVLRPMEVDTADKSFERSISTVTGGESSSLDKSDKSDSADDSGRSSGDEGGRSSSASDYAESNAPSNPRVISDDHDSRLMHPIPQRAGPAVDRSARWAALLDRRPSSDDSNAMSAWLLEVLSVSDGQEGTAPVQHKGNSNDNVDSMPSPLSPNSKKRVHSMVTNSDTSSSPPREDMGSFSDWKDRKKHKGLPKNECTSPSRD